MDRLAIQSSSIISSILLICLFFLTFPRLWKFGKFSLPGGGTVRWMPLCWAIAFLIVSALPYVLVMQGPRFQGWESRHLILFTLSLPIFLFVATCALMGVIKFQNKIDSVDFIFRPTILFVFIVGVISSNLVYKDYQLVAIKQWSIVENLKAKPELRRCSKFEIRDLVGDFSKKEFHWPEASHQAWYAWVAIFTKAWDEQRWYGYNEGEREEYFKGIRYSASDINPAGEKCSLTIKNTSEYGRNKMVINYWRLKYFGTPAQLRSYLLSVSAIESSSANGVGVN